MLNKEQMDQHLKVLESKKVLKVVFLVIHRSVWKVDPVFKAMLDDPNFEPVILICPYLVYGQDIMLEELKEAFDFFETKGYPVINSYDKKTDSWLELTSLEPDVLFFTNPHKLTLPEYYDKAYKNYVSVYVPYHHEVARYADYQPQYNQEFHNFMFKIFVPHAESLQIFQENSFAKGKNVAVTGYPACEEFFEPLQKTAHTPWKKQNNLKKKIIWAPHHTIDDPYLPLSNFVMYASFFKKLAEYYSDDIQIAFKPHPILKSKLYAHEDWGRDKTDDYYQFWERSENTQLELAEYIDLFKDSDAMIHDSSSFLAEYQYLKKPVMFLCNPSSVANFLNPFGIKALVSCYVGTNAIEIDDFIRNVIDESVQANTTFFEGDLLPYYKDSSPSTKILNELKELNSSH